MNIYKKFFLIFNLIFGIIFTSSVTFAVCDFGLDSINVKSKNHKLGDVLGESMIFVKPSLSSYPLSVDFVFENTDVSCFENKEDYVKFQLIPGAVFKSGSMSSSTNSDGIEETTFSFSYNTAFTIIGSLNSKYSISGSESSLTFREDNNNPTLTVSGIEENVLVKSGTNISFDFNVFDSEAGLAEITITGGKTLIYDYLTGELNGEIIDSDGNDIVAPTSYTDAPKSSKIYNIKITDRLGNFAQKSIIVEVDSKPPQIVKLNKFPNLINNNRVVKFTATIEDDSFEQFHTSPSIIGDFSSIDLSSSSVAGSCVKSESNLKQFICTFPNIQITQISSTQTVDLIFEVSDAVLNTKNITEKVEIFVDKLPPVIEKFYVYNKLGIHNIVSLYDENITVKLIAKDDSLIEPQLIIEEFGEIQFAPSRSCVSDEKSGLLTCTWKLGNTIQAYAGFNNLVDAVFKVVVVDRYDNSAEKEVTIYFDSKPPELSRDIEMSNDENIKTSILKSKDSINFRLYFDDLNIIGPGGEQFVYGNFSSVNFDDEFEFKEGRCFILGDETICEFMGIELNKGYYKKNVTFLVSDIAGNFNIFNYELEVFAVSDEVEESFKIEDMLILNPISKERLYEGVVTAWFEGKIETKQEGIEIINYYLLSCNESHLGNLSLIPGEESLYPENKIYYRENGDEEFVLKVELKDHPAMNDMKRKNVECGMAVLKRNESSIFPVEKVKFDVIFDFYNSKRGGLTQALMEDIVSDIDDADLLGEKFDEIYEVYEMLDSVCSGMNSVSGIMSGISSVWTITSVILHNIGYTKAAAYLVDNAIFPASGTVSTLVNNGAIKTMCDYVTCRNGGTLISGFGGDTGIGEWVDDMNIHTNVACTFQFDSKSSEDKD